MAGNAIFLYLYVIIIKRFKLWKTREVRLDGWVRMRPAGI